MKRSHSIPFAALFLAGAFLFSRTPDIGSNLPLFGAGFLMAAAGYLGLLAFGLPARGRGWVPVFILLAVAPRLMALHLLPSDDVARYVWEGRMLLEGVNPYALAPDDPRLIPFRDAVYPLINHRDMPAVYPPVTLCLFAALSLLTRSMEGFRIFFLLIDFVSIGVLFLWVRNLGVSRDKVLIYALNPLVIICTAGHGHLDVLQVIPLAAGLALYSRKREGAALLLLTLAGMIKFLALFALPFLITRKTLKYLPLCGALILSAYLPLLFLRGSFSLGSLVPFFQSFEYFSLTYAPMRWFMGSAGAFTVTAAVLLTVLVSLWLTRSRPEYAVPPFLFLVLLMSPTIHIWYLVPLLALGVVWNSRALIALSVLFLPYFHVLEGLVAHGEFIGAWWRPVATYLPFLVILWVEMSGRWPFSRSRDESVGIVVPVLNDAKPLAALLASLETAGVKRDDVVVADGGSRDHSTEVARRWGARVAVCPRSGRGQQISFGAAHLSTDLVLILHADNIVPVDLLAVLRRSSGAYPENCGGSFRLRYLDPGFRMRLLSVFSNAKASLFGLSFGDQGQWFRRGCVAVPEIPLMEDVELAVRINDAGGAVRTPASLWVSTRRYSDRGSLSVIFSVISFTLGYLFHRRWTGTVPDTAGLYEKYYGHRKSADS
jgi:hypothetical protein